MSTSVTILFCFC